MKKRVRILVALGLATVMSMAALAGCAGKSSGGNSCNDKLLKKLLSQIRFYGILM